ncbi:hypothetical protein F441_15464 [Phytophthora nicotianae CJ01A1]|uniref:Uncharacterized protein n=4 Tax=Phytophthora nicotianae TaxID=4792 RepID=V9EJH2_PHYNI|nr:hypothetical protein F443_15644 [Phytophthora nicotianae P1569]ETK78875.1 hypothetical protein L915_15188 [Phytophthora nicotianae]ETP08581.1 hypothetical protein F441_15464 [Phytophthora nicotianae CJ01A1]ETP36622.1 hypothetical protein F442_15485 [Phytophthora nicotianae P10297]KUG01448.1 hypothetical protein AM587_10015569 [Phytophthora nicotianae]
MGSKHSRLSHQQSLDGKTPPAASRHHDNQEPEAEISAEARAEFTVDDIHSPENTRRAQILRSSDHDRFCKYRNYFKNHHMSLAREVGRKTSKSKAELLCWVEDAVGPLEAGDKFTKDEILEIAMVSVALTEYGESSLAKMYDRGELDALPNIPLHTHNLRMPAKQQACRDGSDAANKDKLEAAHYIGLEVMLRLNERLPVEQRMGEELREILNHPSNLRLMLATSNQVLHKKVDALLINANDVSVSDSKPQRKISAKEYDRLVQIAKHAQDQIFQDAMIAANGHYLYISLREQFKRLDVGDRPKLWDNEKDKPELRKIPRSRYRSPSPVPRQSRTPPSPEKKRDPERRMVQTSSSSPRASEKKHRNPFSRLASKIFHSHKKKHGATARSASTAPLQSEDKANTAKPKIPVNRPKSGEKRNPLATKNTKRQAGKPKKSKQARDPEKGKRQPRTTKAKKTTKTPAPRSNQDSASDDDWSDDSDYVESDQDDNDDRELHVGPRGGKYYLNAAGKKVYVK